MEDFRLYNKASFPLIFTYPKSAKYVETTKKKYLTQVSLRERKEKHERKTPEEIERDKKKNIGAGLLKSIFPKLIVTHLKVYVPAYQSSSKESYFMTLEQYMNLNMWENKKNFPKATHEKIEVNFGRGEIITYKGNTMNYYRSEVLLSDKDDAKQLLSIMYKHVGKHRSYDELYKIIHSIKKRE